MAVVVEAPGMAAADIEIRALDSVTPGNNAPCKYLLSWMKNGEMCGQRLIFQTGALRDAGRNGLTDESLLAVVLDRMRHFQRSGHACAETGKVVEFLQASLEALAARKAHRKELGVLGTEKSRQAEEFDRAAAARRAAEQAKREAAERRAKEKAEKETREQFERDQAAAKARTLAEARAAKPGNHVRYAERAGVVESVERAGLRVNGELVAFDDIKSVFVPADGGPKPPQPVAADRKRKARS